ncbi:MAG: hypothetical protein LBT62_06040 [Deltaproteobacteria bacterium]|jgi:hypothetical protein|nr:hypothetical protein [Deltaproteobacteria bacterium]
MLKDLFLAPGRYLCRKFSRSRKKSRYQSRVLHKGPILELSILSWLIAVAIAYGIVVWLGSPPIPKELLEAKNAAPTVAQTNQQPQTEPTTTTDAQPSQANSGAENSAAASGASATSTGGTTQSAGSSLTQAVSPPTAEIEVAPPQVWLVIVESIPKRARTEAEQSQARYKKKGLEFELLDTDAFPLLKSGMWTLALGPFDTKLEAESAALEIKPKVKDLMVRRGL